MSAVKIIFKRSSLLGKRPTDANLEAGEIGLNTNSTEPGLFFETNNGSVVKVGPTAYLPSQPVQTPSRGELWVDSDTKGLSVGTDQNTWQKVAAPYLGGTNGITVFVAPEYQNSTDSLANDGQTVPFVTINRAILEVTKSIIEDTVSKISLANNRYQIVLAPGQHCVVNSPGTNLSSFGVNFTDPNTEVTQDLLRQFNPEDTGGLILPRGVSIIGLDLEKCEVRPTYVPKYSHPSFPEEYQQQVNGPIYKNEVPSSVFRWAGNTYLSNFTGRDKIKDRLVVQVSSQASTKYAVFTTSSPHGLGFNDFAQVTYSDFADQAGATFNSGAYYVYPINTYDFILSRTSWSGTDVSPILFTSLPASYFSSQFNSDPKFSVSNIYPYFIPTDGISYELHPYSHHRLSLTKNASKEQLNLFYTKVQKAFPTVFGGQVNTGLASAPEVDIVAPTNNDYPNNLTTNSTDNSSPYGNMVNLRSDYGMANGDYDGNLVSGFKSVSINSSTAITLQKDPVAYELYTTSGQNWSQLTKYTQQTLGGSLPVTSVPTNAQLQNLNDAPIPNIRYYYTTLKVQDPVDSRYKSTGITDPDNDFRHFGFRVSGANSYLLAQSTYTIGAAIGCWAREGALISLTNSTTNFGSVSFQAEGFAGIGTLGGANTVNKGFLQTGIVRPLRLLEDSVTSDEQKRILQLGSKILHVSVDPSDPSVQLIFLQKEFEPATILPYSLKPGSAVFTTDGTCTYRAFFVTDGTPTCIRSGNATQNPYSTGGAVLRVRVSDSTIPDGSSIGELDIPYIRRYIDPRTSSEKSYGFYIQSTSPTSQAPQLGSVLRLNQTGQNLSTAIKRNYQFDPGQYGGVAQVFTVDFIETERYSSSPNFNYKITDNSQSTNYVVYASLTDASTPWVQSVPQDSTDPNSNLVPFANPQGSYITYSNKNYYAAENNSWTSLYYDTTFNPINGPTKVSPDKFDSSFVITSVLQSTELISDSWQGYVPDPYYTYYTEGVPAPYSADLSYMRGAVIPYTEFAPQYQIDDDDSSNDLGIIFKRIALDVNPTVLVAPSSIAQTEVKITSPYAGSPSFGRPPVIRLELMSVQQIVLPKEGVSVLELSNSTLGATEYIRVISVNSYIVEAIRDYYPEYSQGVLPATWPIGTTVKVCVSTSFPEPSMYDPNWAVTKATMFRFFELMGYSRNLMAQYLKPQYYGERILLNASIPLSPINGYANVTTAWPVEFNNPSAIIANTHTWQYAGYFDYSRGLPKYQVNQIPNKLSYDYLSMSAWGGRLVVTGATEDNQFVFLGSLREAMTGQFFNTDTPLDSAANRQVYSSPEPIVFPNPVLVYSSDDISGEFDGSRQVFDLTRAGYPVPSTQLSEYGVFVFLGGVVQKPGAAYTIQGVSSGNPISRISFSEAPPVGASCDIRIISTDDNDQSVKVVNLTLSPDFDGTQTFFTVSPPSPALTNLNSFLFLSGVEQNPFGINQTSPAYLVQYVNGQSEMTFLGDSPIEDTVYEMRGILSGDRYQTAGVSTVFVSSTDDISPLFDNTRVTFPLEIDGVPLNPTKVNAQNMFVSLGGVMQIPVTQEGNPLAGLAYSVGLNSVTRVLEIIFSTPPLLGTTCNIRVITSDEFLTCPLPLSLSSSNLQVGPGIKVNSENQITGIDPNLIL